MVQLALSNFSLGQLQDATCSPDKVLPIGSTFGFVLLTLTLQDTKSSSYVFFPPLTSARYQYNIVYAMGLGVGTNGTIGQGVATGAASLVS